jgi:MFS family permease
MGTLRPALTRSRLEHSRADLRRTLQWSLLIILPLLLLLVPWAVVRLSYAQLVLPSFPSQGTGESMNIVAGSASTIVASPSLPNKIVPLYRLPPLDLGEGMTQAAVIASTVILMVGIAVLGHFLIRMGKRLTLFYFLGSAAALVLAFWLLPPIVGPVLSKLAFWMMMAWRSIQGSLGLAQTGTPTTAGTATLPGSGGAETGESFGFVASFISFMAHYAAWVTIIGALIVLVAGFFIWRSLSRAKLQHQGKQRVEKDSPNVPAVPPGIFALYFGLLALLKRIGLIRQPGETPYELTLRAIPSVPWFQQTLERITQTFVLARYGGHFPPAGMESELQRELAQAELDAIQANAASAPRSR